MPQPPTLKEEEEKVTSTSREGEALKMIISHLEDWSSRQSTILEEAFKTIATAKDALTKEPPEDYPTASTADSTCQNLVEDASDVETDNKHEGGLAKQASIELEQCERPSALGSQRTSVAPGVRNLPSLGWLDMDTLHPFLPGKIGRLGDYLVATADNMLGQNPLPNGRLARAIRGRIFEMVSVFVILLNVVVMIYETDSQIQNALSRQHDNEDVFSTFDMTLTCFYIFELACRVYAYRLRFVVTVDWRWNLLDTLLTIAGIQDVMVVSASSSSSNLNVLRLIRIFKLLKTLRLLRVLRSFRDLRLMLNSIIGSLYVMTYALVLIAVVMFAFGIFLSQGVGIYLSESDGSNHDSQDLLMYYWGSVTISMASLYMAVLGGENWRAMADSLITIGQGFRLAFFTFVAFFLLVIVNTITSVFVESAIQAGEKDSTLLIKEEMEHKHKYVQQLKELFNHMDLNNDGVVDFNELVAALERKEMMAFMSKLMIDIHDARQFLDEMSAHGQTNIDLDMFVSKCFKIRGPARSIDLISFTTAQENVNSLLLKELSTLRRTSERLSGGS